MVGKSPNAAREREVVLFQPSTDCRFVRVSIVGENGVVVSLPEELLRQIARGAAGILMRMVDTHQMVVNRVQDQERSFVPTELCLMVQVLVECLLEGLAVGAELVGFGAQEYELQHVGDAALEHETLDVVAVGELDCIDGADRAADRARLGFKPVKRYDS